MSAFLDPLCIQEIDDSTFAIAQHTFRYLSDRLKRTIEVPIGFYTDFASVPRLGMIYAALGDCAHEPAVIHDWLYYCGTTTRDEADEVLLEAMNAIGISAWRRWPIYWGVRAGGWYAWNDHRKKGHSPNRFQEDHPGV